MIKLDINITYIESIWTWFNSVPPSLSRPKQSHSRRRTPAPDAAGSQPANQILASRVELAAVLAQAEWHGAAGYCSKSKTARSMSAIFSASQARNFIANRVDFHCAQQAKKRADHRCGIRSCKKLMGKLNQKPLWISLGISVGRYVDKNKVIHFIFFVQNLSCPDTSFMQHL